jgi:hypothetical protein
MENWPRHPKSNNNVTKEDRVSQPPIVDPSVLAETGVVGSMLGLVPPDLNMSDY